MTFYIVWGSTCVFNKKLHFCIKSFLIICLASFIIGWNILLIRECIFHYFFKRLTGSFNPPIFHEKCKNTKKNGIFKNLATWHLFWKDCYKILLLMFLPPSFGLALGNAQTVMGCETLISLTRPAENFGASKKLNAKLLE